MSHLPAAERMDYSNAVPPDLIKRLQTRQDTTSLTTSTAPCSSNEDIPAVPIELKSVVQAVEVLCNQTHRNRLADFSSVELDFLLKPIVTALEELDAASLLSYKSREGSKGRRFQDYKPMHKFIQPAIRPGLEDQVSRRCRVVVFFIHDTACIIILLLETRFSTSGYINKFWLAIFIHCEA